MLDDDFHALRPGVYEDVHSQLDDMIYEDFVTDLSADRLQHYPRYLQAMLLRLENVEKDPGRDADRMGQVKPFWQQYLGLLEAGRDYDERVDRYRWMIEEFRVSLFAQQLGTPQKVSPQRLQQAWQEIR
jgi:ATP-dependent helicase HrpA